jgi:hypothetical protein
VRKPSARVSVRDIRKFIDANVNYVVAWLTLRRNWQDREGHWYGSADHAENPTLIAPSARPAALGDTAAQELSCWLGAIAVQRYSVPLQSLIAPCGASQQICAN